MNQVPFISGIKDIINNYDVFILDQWGVMHDGRKGYKNAITCVDMLHSYNKELIIISNSSKKKESTKNRLPKLGFDENYFIEIMTSGEMIWQSLINESYEETKNLGINCYHIYDESKKDAKQYLDGLEKYNFVDSLDKADFILGCTPFLNKKVIDYIPLLTLAIKKKLPFICANPDFDTIEYNKSNLSFCMGTIADLYENMGGKKFILGKPNIEIYNQSSKKIKHINKSKFLAIGDSIYHDIKGAKNFGIDSLLITSTGIHSECFDKENPMWDTKFNTLRKLGITPTFLCNEFKF